MLRGSGWVAGFVVLIAGHGLLAAPGGESGPLTAHSEGSTAPRGEMPVPVLRAGLTAGAGPVGEAAPALHDLHETYADLAMEERLVAGRLQFFKSDLERALGPMLHSDAVSLTPGAEADALVLRYLRDRLTLVAVGDTLQPTLHRAGPIELGHHEGWELTVSWEAPEPVRDLRVRNTLLFELHDDQRNVMRFARFPGEKRETVTLEPGAPETVLTWSPGSGGV